MIGAKLGRRSVKPAPSGGGTFTVFAEPYSESGHLQSIDNGGVADYSAARAGTGNLGVSVNAGFWVGQYYFFDGEVSEEQYSCKVSCLSFDTSGVTGTVDTAVLAMYGSSQVISTNFTLEARLRDYGVALDNSDWVAGADLGTLTLLASYDTSSGGMIGNYFDLTEVALADNINQAGFTRIFVCSSRHRLGNAPNSGAPDERILFDVNTDPPKLTIVTV